MLFSEKYSPKNLESIVGNETIKEKVRKWILDWLRNKKSKPLLIYGPTGTGKTSFAYALKHEFDLELIEMNASQFRNKKNVDQIMANAMLAGTLSGKKKIILIDDVDILGRKDRGGAGEIAKLIKLTNVPIILTAEDAWVKKISSIRMLSTLMQLKRITKNTIRKVLDNIVELEGIEISDEKLERITQNSNGDVRSALNDLQAQNTHNRDREKDIFNLVREIFKAENYLEVKRIMGRDVDINIAKLWIDENIANEYSKKEDIAKAYYYMARADQFEGRIRFTNWKYLKYVIDFFSAGVALSKTKKNFSFVKYKFPKYLRDMSASVIRRARMKSIGLKISKKVHVNSIESRTYLPIISQMLETQREKVQNYYGFSDEEVDFILKIPMQKIKIKTKAKSKKKREIEEEDKPKKIEKMDSILKDEEKKNDKETKVRNSNLSEFL